MKQFLYLWLLLIMTSLSQAQITIRPGDRIIRYDWIQPSHSFYRNVISDTAGNVKYDFMMDDYIIIDPQTKAITFARYRQVPAGYFEADTSVTSPALKPIRMHEVHSPQNVTYQMDFGDTLATVTTNRKGIISVKNYGMSSGYFEDNMIGYIFGYLELKKGITYTLDNFNKDAAAPSDPYTLEYAFEDVWHLAPDHNLYCTVVRFTHGGTSGIIWIDKSTHEVIKTVATFKTGSYVLTKI